MVDLRSEAARIAQEEGIDPNLFLRLVQQESGFNPNAVSSAGAIGLGQLMPATAAELGVDPRDPMQNLRGAARYLRQQLDAFGGDQRLALAAYNAGPGNVRKYGGIPPFKETQNYVARILGTGNGGSTVRGSSRNFSGGPDLEPEQTGLLGFITDPEKRARLALALSGMALNPNQAVQALAQDKLATAETGRINNRTAQWLSQRGRDDLAEAVMRGIVPAKEAVTQAMKPTDELRNLQIETARVNLDRLKSGADADPNVQSSASLPDQSGVVITMRDGTVQVRTVGGEVLDGQAALDFVRTAQENAANYQRSIYEARRTGTLGADIALGGAAAQVAREGALRPEIVQDFMTQAKNVGSSVNNMDSAIAAIDQGAQSGIVYDMLPSVTLASAELQNARQRLGIDVIGSVTFGALSESEMNMAMDTALPRGLAPPELRKWLVSKREAQARAYTALQEAAMHFASGGTQEEYLRKIGVALASPASPAAPAAPNTGANTGTNLNRVTVGEPF